MEVECPGCPPLLSLPAAILERIFSLLPVQDIAVVGLSCQQLSRVSQSDPLWLAVCQAAWGDRTIVTRWLSNKPLGCFALPLYRDLAPVSYRCRALRP